MSHSCWFYLPRPLEQGHAEVYAKRLVDVLSLRGLILLLIISSFRDPIIIISSAFQLFFLIETIHFGEGKRLPRRCGIGRLTMSSESLLAGAVRKVGLPEHCLRLSRLVSCLLWYGDHHGWPCLVRGRRLALFPA